MQISVDTSWKTHLDVQFQAPYFSSLIEFVEHEYEKGTVYPSYEHIFRAFELCPFDDVKVVILGQDPYHGKGQANGLSFAVGKGVALPPSLRNIFKEITADVGIEPLPNGDLSRWAAQGVLLLNATLTVRAGIAGSHQKKGWEQFTDAVIEVLSREREHIVFMLWGNYAKQKGGRIDRAKHCVLEAAHPSPLSAHHGFFGCKHFSAANAYLQEHGTQSIDWR